MKIINYLSKNWILIIIIIIGGYILIDGDADIRKYKKEIKELKSDIKDLNKIIENNLILIDELSKQDTIYLEKIKIIKQKADVQTIYVDTMSISDKQNFFSERYRE